MEKIFLGTYTRHNSRGIYRVILDNQKEILRNVELMIPENNPTYLAIDHHSHLFTVTKKAQGGGIASYTCCDDGHHYKLNNTLIESVDPLCYISIDEKRQLVFGANYHQGLLYSYEILEDGSLMLADKIQHHGSGPHPNQKSAHVHYAHLTPDNRLAVCDLGTDEIYTYDVGITGKLTEVARLHVTPGSGPRHMVFHPDHRHAYLVNELNNTMQILTYDSGSGMFTIQRTYNVLPHQDSMSSSSAIRLSSDGRFLYVSVRGHNSISVFRLSDQFNEAEMVQIISTEGDGPRDFNFNSSDDFIIVGHQYSNQLTLFKRDKETGLLTLKQKDVYAPEVVCVIPAEN